MRFLPSPGVKALWLATAPKGFALGPTLGPRSTPLKLAAMTVFQPQGMACAGARRTLLAAWPAGAPADSVLSLTPWGGPGHALTPFHLGLLDDPNAGPGQREFMHHPSLQHWCPALTASVAMSACAPGR